MSGEEVIEVISPVKTFMYEGKSMNPTFFDKDMVDVGIYHDFSEIKVGDIVITKSLNITGNKCVCHRIVEITEEGRIKTRGDNNSGVDSWELTINDLEGKVINADRPRRIQRRLVYNQYCKQDREIVEQIAEQDRVEREQIEGVIDDLNQSLLNSPEHAALFESQLWVDYLQAMSDLTQAESDFEEGIITQEALDIAKQEFSAISETTMNNQLYVNYYTLSQHSDLKEAYDNLQEFEYNIMRLENNSQEAREGEKIVGFPVMILNIPEYLDWNRRVIPESKKLYHKIGDLQKLSLWENAWKNNVRKLIGTEKININKN
jgi:signal peptidase I